MNFSAWFSRVTHRKPVDPISECHSIEPLLSLYSDKMTTPAESARVEAHLLECEDCRRALSWMQATNAVLAHREPVTPPPDMSLRIRSAIADLESGKNARPARTLLVYRPAFAAAFTILIGAVVVAQITLRHGDQNHTTPNGGNHIASQPSPEIAPNVTPLSAGKPAVAPAPPVHRSSGAQLARRLPSESLHESSVGGGARPETGDKAVQPGAIDLSSGNRLAALPQVKIHDAHSKAPKAFVIPSSTGARTASAPHNSLHTSPVVVNKHPDDAMVATHDIPVHSTPETPTNVVPAPPTPEAPAPETVHVATADTHPNDVLSGVRSKVDYMHTVAFALPSSARAVHLTRHTNETGAIDPSRGSESGTIAVVYDPGPSEAPQHPVRAADASYQRNGNG